MHLPSRIELLAWAVPILLGFVLVAAHSSQIDLSSDTAPERAFRDSLNIVPKDSIVIIYDERLYFTFWYYKYAEHLANDLVVINPNLLQFTWYQTDLAHLYPQIPTYSGQMVTWLRDNSFAARTIASDEYISVLPGRRNQRIEGWYLQYP